MMMPRMERGSVLLLAVVACAAMMAAVVNGAGEGPTRVKILDGEVQGFATKDARIWKGIPYAAPPVGERRWTSTTKVTPWSSVKNTTTFGPGCPQQCHLPPLGCQADLSEDCLYLNVYAPLKQGKYAVMVWFHGGRYEQGSEGVELYDAQRVVAAHDVVVVTVNYRLGVLGFLAMPDLGLEGNYGLLDQQFSLRWVRDNVAAFGGDPSKVTIFGQSAGATSVSTHLVSPQSKGLFRGAIVESSPYALPLLTPDKAGEHYAVFAKDAGCNPSDKKCLYSLTPDQVVTAQMTAQNKIWLDRPLVMFFPWTPTVDGKLLPADPLTAIGKGEYNKVPVVIGNVGQEAWPFVFEAFPKLNKLEAEALIDVIFGGHHEPKEIRKMYPVPEHMDDYRPYISRLASDFIIDCSSRNVTLRMREDNVPVYHYVFDHAWDERGHWGPNYTFCEGHACHAVELPFVFDSAPLCGVNFDAKEKQLTKSLTAYWTNFAKTLAPGTSHNVTWPVFTKKEQPSLNFTTAGVQSHVQNNIRAKYCDFWDLSPKGYVF
ncbi:cholinesterase [Salpingoeca rosetta]|uniref:Carboxylic ester hydrolase n=1 Tax=Salpingoeca rosetta (strain ATCC 50818 / BSB-021) TaxID=946362 RepID=F2U7R4_SALR5|nr:cholinesterase [Salpingoeca rosetta]EGD72819.1 cholinesterase [Salpingoeca rosetta]|eukprot:XP_004994642.1 cholinesterase [Salpingoeca rosetta]